MRGRYGGLIAITGLQLNTVDHGGRIVEGSFSDCFGVARAVSPGSVPASSAVPPPATPNAVGKGRGQPQAYQEVQAPSPYSSHSPYTVAGYPPSQAPSPYPRLPPAPAGFSHAPSQVPSDSSSRRRGTSYASSQPPPPASGRSTPEQSRKRFREDGSYSSAEPKRSSSSSARGTRSLPRTSNQPSRGSGYINLSSSGLPGGLSDDGEDFGAYNTSVGAPGYQQSTPSSSSARERPVYQEATSSSDRRQAPIQDHHATSIAAIAASVQSLTDTVQVLGVRLTALTEHVHQAEEMANLRRVNEELKARLLAAADPTVKKE